MNRKAEENAHNEILAFLMAIMGVNLLMGGLIIVTIVVGEPSWLFTFPYEPLQTSSAYLGLVLTFTGFIILLAGSIIAVHYDRKRLWYIRELHKSSLHEKLKTSHAEANPILEETAGKSGKKKE
jgi:hypothetical protein